MERLFKGPMEDEAILDPILVDTLNKIEAKKLELNDRAEALSDQHDRLETNLDALRTMLDSAVRSGDRERLKTLETATQAVLSRMESLRNRMQAVLDEIDETDGYIDDLVRLPVPINE